MPEAMKKVRAELGNDAIILHSKVIHTGGFLGFFKKRNIEVLAAIDPGANVETIPVKKKKINILPQKLDENAGKEKNLLSADADFSTNEVVKQLEQLNDAVQEIRQKDTISQVALPLPVQTVITCFEKQHVDQQLQTKITKKIVERWYLEGADKSIHDVKSWAEEYLYNEISPNLFGELSLSKKFINVVGPTGVGKTTTLAKMAANFMLKHQKKIGFITTDTYRIAAIEQLKTYANILNVPLEVCYSLEDFELAAKKLESCDVILIDTAGRNFRNQQYVEDLKKVVDYKREMETLLVLSLTAKQEDMEDIYQQFSTIDIDHFIFTKMDETSSYGSMINLIVKYQKGVAYLTTGQNVPDDMLLANPKDIVKRIIGVD